MVDDHDGVQLAVDAINKSPSIKLELKNDDDHSVIIWCQKKNGCEI